MFLKGEQEDMLDWVNFINKKVGARHPKHQNMSGKEEKGWVSWRLLEVDDCWILISTGFGTDKH